MAYFPLHLCCLLADSSQVEPMEKGVSNRSKLPDLYELEASLRPCVTGSYDRNIRGGYLLEKQQVTKKRKRIVWLFALLGLLPLLVFKYYNFLNDSIREGLAAVGLQFSLPGLNWAIPVGISFFTFQAVGYMLDVYHGRVKAEKNLLDYVLFVSFFPQVMSGPISKADELLPRIKNPHKFDYDQGRKGLKQLLWGMFIKLDVAVPSSVSKPKPSTYKD